MVELDYFSKSSPVDEHNGVFDEVKSYIAIDTDNVSLSSKLVFEKKGDDAALFEGHWWGRRYSHDGVSVYLSSHSGCPIGCRFCGTRNKWIRPATFEELKEQFLVQIAQIEEKFLSLDECGDKKIKFLYMGDPLLNIEAVDEFVRWVQVHYPHWYTIISTVAPNTDWVRVKNLIRDFPGNVSLTFSIHKLTDEERNKHIPYEDKLTLAEIKQLGEELFDIGGGEYPIWLSYMTFKGKQDKSHAKRFAELFPPDKWNPTILFTYSIDGKDDRPNGYEQNEVIEGFVSELRELGYWQSMGFYSPVEFSSDMPFGCGQFYDFQRYCKEHGIKQNLLGKYDEASDISQ